MHETQTQARKRVGEIFRAKRDEMHLSLKEVENATSIRMMYLQAIEEGHIDKFLSPVYALGFVRQYAAFLGFDGQRIVDENKEAFHMQVPKSDPPYGIGTLEKRGMPHTGSRNMPNAFWIGISIAVLIGAFFFAKFLGVL